MRERAISAAVLVPVLLIVLGIGGPVLALAVTLITAARRGRGLPAPPRRRVRAVPRSRDGLRGRRSSSTPRSRRSSRAAGSCSVRSGSCLSRSASFIKEDPRDGLQAWMATVFGAFYVSLLSFIIRLGHAGPGVPASAPLDVARRRARLDPAARARGLGVRHGRLPRRQDLRSDEVHRPTSRRQRRSRAWSAGSSPRTVVVGGDAVRPRPEPAPRAAPRAADRARRAGRRPRRNRSSSGLPAPRTRAALIPGHGGMLDRVDSFVFAAPVMTLYVLTFLR